MSSLQEKILIWRFSNNLPKSIIGFWIKAFIEAGIAIGVLVAGLILVVSWVFDFSFGNILPLGISETSSNIITWIVLTGWLWIRFRCLLAEGVLPDELAQDIQQVSKAADEN